MDGETALLPNVLVSASWTGADCLEIHLTVESGSYLWCTDLVVSLPEGEDPLVLAADYASNRSEDGGPWESYAEGITGTAAISTASGRLGRVGGPPLGLAFELTGAHGRPSGEFHHQGRVWLESEALLGRPD